MYPIIFIVHNVLRSSTSFTFSKVPSEEAVFEAVISWIKQDEKKRKEMLPRMLEFVRLPLLTPRYITDIVDSEASKLSCLTFFLFV